MPYNLLDERWIPVRRRSGARGMIAPWELGDPQDPPLRIESPRPDFDGALLQFLIGLMQTAAAPESKGEWERRYEQPHAPEELRERFGRYRQAFNLDGEGPRFMQDLSLDEAQSETSVDALLMSAPGDNAAEKNTDFFVKRGGAPTMGYPALAAALYALQCSAPTGGQGHRTSLRGGGPLTTVLAGDTLVRTAWLNVLRREAFESRGGNAARNRPEDIFPWLATTRTSEKNTGRPTTPDDVHPLQQYWAMPRRLRVDLRAPALGRCAILGTDAVPVASRFVAKNYGPEYAGPFLHPLTPHTLMKDGEPPNPRKLKADGLPYRDWLHYASGTEERAPARVVAAWVEEDRHEIASDARLLAFGYAMDNMKPLGWFEGKAPLVAVPESLRSAFRALVQGLVEVADEVRRTLVAQLKAALDRRPGDMKADAALLSQVSRAFWSRTESGFFDSVRAARDALVGDLPREPILERWLSHLHSSAKALFESHSQERGEFAATDVKRVAQAWSSLVRLTSPRDERLRDIVGLPALENAPAQRGVKEVP